MERQKKREETLVTTHANVMPSYKTYCRINWNRRGSIYIDRSRPVAHNRLIGIFLFSIIIKKKFMETYVVYGSPVIFSKTPLTF